MLGEGPSAKGAHGCRLLFLSALAVGSMLALPANAAGAALAITSEQVADFAGLLDEPAANVERALLWDPGLAPLAVAALDAHMARKKTGRNMIITGATLMGSGITVGFLLGFASFCLDVSAECRSKSAESDRDTKLVFGVSVGIGLLLAVPGIIKMARQSSAERGAEERYWRPRVERPQVQASDRSRPWVARPTANALPLSLSFAF